MVMLVEFIKDVFKYIVIIGIIVLIRIFVLTSTEVVGDSMLPTLNDGNFMLVEQLSNKFNAIHRFDIIVMKYDSPNYLIKRVIGLPGEKIKYISNKLFVNDYLIEEEFEHQGTISDFEVTLTEGLYFVIGDNRDNSEDSRVFGPIEKESIIGRPFLTLYPFDKFGLNK